MSKLLLCRSLTRSVVEPNKLLFIGMIWIILSFDFTGSAHPSYIKLKPIQDW